MINKGILIILALVLSVSYAQPALAAPVVEVFDVQKEEVVHRTSLNKQIESEATKLLKDATGLVTKIDPIPKTGFLLKVPLSEPIALDNPWIKTSINQVIFVLSEEDTPSFMVINEQNQSIFLYFNGDVDSLLQAIDFKVDQF